MLAKGLAILLYYAAGHDLCGDGTALYGGAQQTFTTFMVVCDVWWSGNNQHLPTYTQALFRAWWLGWWGFYKTEGQFQH